MSTHVPRTATEEANLSEDAGVGLLIVSTGVPGVPLATKVPENDTPTLSWFLILIGVMLVAEGLGQHVSKGYIYFAMAFSLVVEMINMRVRKGVAKPPEAT